MERIWEQGGKARIESDTLGDLLSEERIMESRRVGYPDMSFLVHEVKLGESWGSVISAIMRR
eukprot:6735519-Prorocentrum_lima.AAC.1